MAQEVSRVPDHARHDCSPAGCILETRETDGQRSVWEFDPVKGKGKLLFKREGGGEAVLSSDGRLAAYSPGAPNALTNHIRLVRTGDGALERDIEVPEVRFLTSLEWDSQSRGFFAGAMVLSTGAILLHIDMKGKTRELWRQSGTRTVWGVPSPDGKHLAISGATRDSNVWVMEGY
jgi:hypothetical protein